MWHFPSELSSYPELTFLVVKEGAFHKDGEFSLESQRAVAIAGDLSG